MAPARNMRKAGTLRAFLHLLRPITVHVILAIGAALGAYFASGILRVILIVLAVLLGALVAWGVFLAAFLITLARSLKRWQNQR